MKSTKKITALLLVFCLIFAICPVLTAYADNDAETDEDLVTGDFGSGFSYVYNKVHDLLIVHGEGPLVMPDPAPWDEYKDEISRVILDEGITSVPAGGFSGLSKLYSVVFPVSLEKLDPDSFADCGTVYYASTTGSTNAVRAILKEAGISALRGPNVTRVSEKSLADEISSLEKPGFDRYYYSPGEWLPLEVIKEQMFRDAVDKLLYGK